MRLYHIIICIVISFVYSAPVLGQDLLFSESEKTNSGVDQVQVVGQLKDKIVTFVNVGNQAQLIWYNLNLDRLGYTDLDFYTKDIADIELSVMGDEVHIFFQERDKRMVRLYVTKVFDKDESFSPILLDSAELKGVFDKTKFEVVHNTRGMKHFYGLVQNVSGQDLLYINHTVLNQSLAIVQRYEKELATTRRYELIEMNVDETGQFYSLIGEMRGTKKNYEELALITKRVGDNEITNLAIDLKNYAYSGLQSKFDTDESHLYFGGLFHKTRNAEPEGVIALVYSRAQNKIIRQHIAPIVMQGTIGSNVLDQLEMRGIRIGADNGFEIIAEKSYVESRNVGTSVGLMSPMGGIAPGGNRIETIYHDQDIYIFNMKADGSLHWTQSILKNQESRQNYGAFTSFTKLEHPLGAVYLFNEMGKNGRVITAYVSNKGELSLKQLPGANLGNNDDKELILRGAQQISKDVLIAPAISKGDLSFVKISF